MKKTSSISVIIFAFSANFIIATVKFIVSFITHSSAMLAEAIHSLADTLNQVLLIVGIKRAEKKPDKLHPFGFSGELYFWSFVVAILLFTAGAVFSIYEGIHKIKHPGEIKNTLYAVVVLVIAIIAEGAAFLKASRKINIERKDKSIFKYLKCSKHSELIVVFLEDSAALCGLSVALIFIVVQHFTGFLMLDGIASILIGIILAFVAFFLARETQSLLIGEAADPALIKKITHIFSSDKNINKVINIKSLQFGPDDIMLAVKLEFRDNLSAEKISELINIYEKKIREECPSINRIFIEPDIFND